MEKILKKVRDNFTSTFNEQPLIVASPGRINLIGEHTDYNDGYVLPAAIDKYIIGAFSSCESESYTIKALDLDEEVTIATDNIQPRPKGNWVNYPLGVIHEIKKKGKVVPGFNLVFSGNIPSGGGLSSSAALENCFVYGLNELFQLELSKEEMITIAMKAEHNYVGVECGIMDQFASMHGIKDHAILLDCRSLYSKHIPLYLDEYQLLLLNTNVKHSLADSPYNQRREECQTGVRMLQKTYSKIQSLRDAKLEHLDAIKGDISDIVYKRCSYVIEENDRVLKAVEAHKSHQWNELGQLLYQSHSGLQHKYEVSCEELDFLVDQTQDRPDVLGSRMMGGGFGGCTLNLVKKEGIDRFIEEMKTAYHQQFNLWLDAYPITITDGTQLIV